MNVGADYTFGVGSGLNVVMEHLLATADERALHFENVSNTGALTLSYPLGFFDRLNAVATFNWESSEGAYFLNYEHQFNKFSGFIMAFYNPDQSFGLLTQDVDFSLAGPGVRLMLVYNH